MIVSRWPWVAFGAVAIAAIVTTASAWTWVGRPFAGFLIDPGWKVSRLPPLASWTGAHAFLAPGTRILAIDGEPVAGRRVTDLIGAYRLGRPGEAHRYDVLGPGRVARDERRVVGARIQEMTAPDFMRAFGLVLVQIWLCLILAGALLRLGGDSLDARRIGLVGLAVPALVIAYIEPALQAFHEPPLLPGIALFPGIGLVGVAIGGLALIRRPGQGEANRLGWPGLVLAFTALMPILWWSWPGAPGTLGLAMLPFVVVLAICSYVVLQPRVPALDRWTARAFTHAMLGLLAATCWLGLHQLAALLFGLGAALVPPPDPQLLGQAALAIDLLLSVAGVAITLPLHSLVGPFFVQWFVKTRYNAGDVLSGFARAAREAYDPDALAARFYQDLRETLDPSAAVVYLSDLGRMLPVHSAGCQPPEPIDQAALADMPAGQLVVPPSGRLALPFEPRLALALEGVTQRQRHEGARVWGSRSEREERTADKSDESFGSHMGESTPRYEQGPIALLVLGDRRSMERYTAADRDLVSALGHIFARGVQTSRRLSRRAAEDRQRRELEAAWEIQAHLLPRELPSLEGVDVEAYARSARDAGGDFYDVLPVDANRWGILLGEASGSGIPAALLASVALSFFRSTALGTTSPAEAFGIVNNLLCLYKPAARISVRASYAVYDRRDRTLAISNAGQGHPLLNGWPLKIEGVPLGFGRDAAFAEMSFTLKKGDIALWCSDGVATAIGEDGSPFGRDRLLAFARDEGLRGAEEPWSLRDHLRGFMGDAEQADDITYLMAAIR